MLQELTESKHAIREAKGEQHIRAKPQIFALRQPSSAASTGGKGPRHGKAAVRAWQPDYGTHFLDVATNIYFLVRAVA